MQTVLLSGTKIVASRFIFGTGSLIHCGSEKSRLTLLHSAVDSGFTHFDTAPYYGFGIAERDLGTILKKHKHVTITTKVGMYSPGGEDQSPLIVYLRKGAGRVFKSISRPEIDFSVSRANSALEGSLRRLKRERIDIYTLHEPVLPVINSDEWQKWVEQRIERGTIGHFGISATADKLEPFLIASSGFTSFVQMKDSLMNLEADILSRYGRPLQVTYGYVSAARDAGLLMEPREVLRQALIRNSSGAIIVSTSKIARLHQYGRLVEETSIAR